jgi:ArsR family transcriptional regulator, cadmium/lead-responsive transcriptional repressor
MAATEPLTQIPGARLRLPETLTDQDLLAKYFRALGNPTRLAILELLREHGELNVQDIVGRTGSTQPQVSNHLACLRWCGFVTTRREHRAIYYRLADERVDRVLDLARSLLSDNAEHVAACNVIDKNRS